MTCTTRNHRYSRSGITEAIDILSPINTMEEMAKRIESTPVASIRFINMNQKLQSLFAPTMIYDSGGVPTKIVGNAADSLADIQLTELGTDALKYTVNVMRKADIDTRVQMGQALTADKTKGTKWESLKHKDLVAFSIPSVLLLPYGSHEIQGKITDPDVLLKVKEKWGEEAHFWAISASQACTDAHEITKLFSNCGGQETAMLGDEFISTMLSLIHI